MSRKIFYLSLFLYALQFSNLTFCQTIDATSFRLNTRLSFYSFEKSGEMLLHLPPSVHGAYLNVTLKTGNTEIASWQGRSWKKIVRIPFDLQMTPSEYRVKAEIGTDDGRRFLTYCTLTILNHKPNEVKTDNLTGGLVVDKRGFFPFGFFCYSPVHPTLPEEEVVRGFNMISPYQKILPETLNERKAYMDRCAQIGMKVHYNLLSVSGGGGVGSRIEGITDEEKRSLLLTEIKAFMDHPALLAWYIADEPNGYRIPPGYLEEIYRTVREADPWHPVTIVFMAPFLSSRRYSNALDIVMADPYPIPDSPVTVAGNTSAQLRREFEGRKPVWIVPQAFGGSEWWSREPTIQEIRSMTYQAVINGARGIQYFVRQGLNLFPKSAAAWSECGRMALEIAEITPWLLSDEEAMAVYSDTPKISVSSAMKNGQLLIMAVNTTNTPRKAGIRIAGSFSGKANVIFENRSVTMNAGLINDYLPALGSQVYLLTLDTQKESVRPYRGNLIRDPGFENISSPGIPASCYAWNNGDRGATFFIDSREHYEGNHSLRMVTPTENKSARLRFFPFTITKGRTYTITVWAKADCHYKQPSNDPGKDPDNETGKCLMPYFEIGLGEYGKARFTPGEDWQQFVTSVTIPVDYDLPPRTNVILQMPGEGVAWFDMLQVFEAVDLRRSINPEILRDWD